MQQNPASRTVKGLNIAILVLSVLCALSMVFCMGSTGLIQGYVNEHSDNIANAINEGIADGSINMSVSVDSEDAAKLAEVAQTLAATGNDDLANVANMLSGVAEGDVSSMLNFFSNVDATSLINMKNSVANMTDAQLQAIVDANPSVKLADLQELRAEAAGISDSDINTLYSFLGSDGNAVTATSTLVGLSFQMIFGFILVCAIITMIASIMAIRNADKPEKLGGAFVMAIVGAVAGAISGGLVRLVLHIVSAVYISKVRRTPQAPQYQQQEVQYPGVMQQ